MKTLRSLVFVSLALLLPASAIAQESPFKFEFHGFVTGSLYYQDQAFLNAQGQGLLLAAPAPTNDVGGDLTGATLPNDGKLLSGDIRNTRFSFSVTGPSTMGATPRGYIELDFFGPYGGGNFGTEQQLPRLRVAIAELKFGSTLIQVGQQNQLVVPQIPASIVHIANPVTYGAGTIGWRTPGVRIVHTLALGANKLELAAEVVKNKWADAAVGTPAAPQGTPASISLGEASGMPMVQGRLKLDGKSGTLGYSAYLVGVWHQIDLDGFGGNVTPATDDGTLDGYAVEVGGRVNLAMVTVAANYYMGQATGNMLGTIVQFGDIADWGAYVNVGVNLSKEFSIWGLYGLSRPDEDDVRTLLSATNPLVRFENDLYGAMVRYASGGYQVGVEWYQNKTKWGALAGSPVAAADNTDTTAMQVIASAGYFF